MVYISPGAHTDGICADVVAAFVITTRYKLCVSSKHRHSVAVTKGSITNAI